MRCVSTGSYRSYRRKTDVPLCRRVRARPPLEARRWTDAAISAKDAALETGSEGIDTARRLSGDARDTAVGLGTEGVGVAKRLANDTGDAARSATDRLSGKVAKRIRRKSDPGS